MTDPLVRAVSKADVHITSLDVHDNPDIESDAASMGQEPVSDFQYHFSSWSRYLTKCAQSVGLLCGNVEWDMRSV